MTGEQSTLIITVSGQQMRREGHSAGGKWWHKAGSALGARLELGQELVLEEHFAETEVLGWPARGTPMPAGGPSSLC